jgi:hypothetical protein
MDVQGAKNYAEENFRRKLPDAEDAKVTQRTQKRKYQNNAKNKIQNED